MPTSTKLVDAYEEVKPFTWISVNDAIPTPSHHLDSYLFTDGRSLFVGLASSSEAHGPGVFCGYDGHGLMRDGDHNEMVDRAYFKFSPKGRPITHWMLLHYPSGNPYGGLEERDED